MAAVPEPAGMQAKRAGLPLQSEGMEPGSLDPAEVQQLREQVKNLSRFVGMPGEAGAPGAQGQQQEPQRRGNAIAVVSGDRAMGSSPWGQPGRLNAPGQGGSVAEGLGQVSGDVERLKKQVAAMGSAMQAAGMQLPPEAMGEGADGAAGMPPPEPVIEGMGATRSRAPIQVQTGMPQYGQGQMAQAPNKLPPQSPGAIEPVAAEVSNLRREVAAMKQVLAMSPATAQHAAAMASQQPLQQERGGMSPEKAAAVASEPWGQGPRPASLPVDQMQRAPQSDNLSKDLEAVKRRQEARKRNPVMVAATVPEYGQSNMNAPNRAPPPLEQMQGVPEPVVAHLGAMQNDLRQMQQFLGMRQVSQDPSRPQQPGQPVLAPMDRGPAGAPASQPWGNTRDGPGGEPRVEKLSDLVKEVQDARARQEGVEKVLRSMGASMPWDDGRQPGGAGPGQAGPDGAAPEPGSQAAQRRGNAIAVTGGAPVYGQPGMQAPERAAQAGAAPGAPAQLEPQLQQVTEELRRVQNFLGLPPQQMGAAGQAGPGAGPGGRGADPAQAGRGGPQDQWGAPGRDRQWGEQPKNLGEVLRDVDYSKRRVKELEDAMRAAGINVPPPGEGAGPGEGGLTPEQQAAQRSRNPVTVAAGVPDVGQLKAMPPMGKPVYGADGQPEPTQAEVARLNEEVKRMQQVLNNIAPGQLQQQGQQPGQEGGRGKGGAVLVNAGPMEPWGAAGRDPKLAAPGEAKSVADIGRELDQTKRRMHQLEDAMRAAGIPLPPPEGAEPGLEPNLPDSAVSSAGRPRQGVNVMASNANYGPQSYNAQGKLKSLEGLPEPAQAELNRMAEEIKRMQQVMSMQPSSAERMGQPPEPRGSAAAAAPAEPARGAQEEWGGPGRPATLPEPVRNMGDVVKNLEDTNQRLAQLEQMMGVMPGAAGAPQPGAGGEGEAAKQEEQRRRGPVAVVAAVPMYGGPGQVAPNRGPGGAAGTEGAAAGPLEPQLQSMAEDMRKMKQVLGIQPVMQSAPGVQAAQAQGRGGPQDPGMSGLPESWGQPGREPRQQGDPPRNMGEVVKDVDYNTRRTRQLEDAMRAAGIPVPPPPTDGPGKGDGGQWAGSTPEEVAARKRNAINVQGGHPDYGPPTYAAPGTKLKSLEGLPEPAQAEISNLAHEVKRLQQFMNMNPPGQAPPPAKAAPALEPMRAAELPKGANDPWSQPGRDPRMPGEPPRNMGDMVQELDKSQKRMAQLEDAMRAAGINVPPPEGAGPGAGESPAEQQQAQQRQRNTIAVVASTPDYGPKLSAPPGKKLQSLEGLPEPAKAELEKMADDIKRLQQFMAMGGPEQAAMQPMLEPQVKQMPGQPGAPPQMQQWGQPGAPRMPGESPKNMGEVVKDVDQTKRRVHQLEDAMRAAGIPIPPPDGPGGPGAGGEYEGSSPEEIARGKRNPIGVKAGNPEYGEKAFGAPGRNPALADLPAPVAAELQRMDQELKKVQQFMNMNPPGQAPPPAKAAPALEPMRAAELPKGANDPWSQPGRDPRMPADAPKSIADMVQEMDSNRKRINELEDALRAAGIPFKPADGSALAGEAEREQQQQAGRPKRNTVVAVASVPDYGPGLKAPGQKLQSLEGLPEPAKAELEKMADDIKRLQQFMAMGGPEQAAMQPMLEPQVKQMPGQPGAAPQFQQWGQAGRDPRMPEVAPKNIGEVVKDVDQTKRRVHQLEDAMRAAGIPVPPPDGAAGMEGSSPEAQAEAERRRNAIGVKAGNPEYGEKAFGAPGRNPALAGLPPAAQAELQRMDDDMRRMQQQMQQMGPALAAAQQAAAANASEPGAADGRGPNEQWGGPGRPAALPEPIQAAGKCSNTAQEVEQTKRRIKELEDAMQAAGIPLRPGEAPAGAPGAEAEKDKEQARPKRNAVGVVAVAPVYGPNSFNAPERKPNLEGVPEPVKAELQAMADDIKRMHQFMAMPPPVIQPMPEKPGQAPQRAMPGQPGAPQQMQQWGQPGRPREPGEPPRNMGEVVNDLDNNRKRIRELEDAVRAAGIPIQPADGPSAASVPEGATPEEVARARRNPIGVTAGNPEYADQRLAAPGRNAPAAVPPEAVQAELQQLKDEVKRVQQHLGMPPPGQAPAKVAAVPLEPMRAAEVQRPGPQEQWGQPGREPRKPGEPPRNMEEAAKDVADVKKQMAQMADAIRAAGIPFNPPPEPGAEADKQGEAPGRPKRNPIAVSAGNPEYANQKFSAPEKAAAMASLPEPVKAEIKDLRRELERLKNHTGLPPPVIAPIPGQPAGRQAMQEVQRPGPQDQWGQPGRPRQPGEPPRNMEEAAKDVADLKKQLGQMADAMRAAGLPVPPGVESANPATPGEQEKAGDPRRARNAVKVTPGEMPADQRTFAQPSRPGEAPMPEALPAKVDDLQKEIRQLKQALGMPAELPAAKPADPKAKPGAMASEAAPWAEPGREKPLAATVKDVAKDVDDVKKKLDDLDKAVKAAAMGQMLPREAGAANVQGIDVKPGEQPGAADKKKNPIQVTAGQPEAAGPGFKNGVKQKSVDVPEGIAEPVVIDGEELKAMKKALGDLQQAVWAQPAAQGEPKKGKSLKEDTDDIKKFVRAMGKDVGAMGNDMQALKKHLDDVENAMNKALANLAGELAKLKAAQDADGDRRKPGATLETAGDNMNDTLNAMAALNAAQQQQLARAPGDNRSDDIDALNEAMRQSENQLARLLAFLKQDVMDRFNVHEKTLIRMAKQIDFVQKLLKGEGDYDRSGGDGGSALTVQGNDGNMLYSDGAGAGAGAGASKYGDNPFGSAFG
ncbi:hypothetical protein HYH03_006068 [Edaphochlamys debaryana]|uniref:Uncharacterized protein n=1 Tax=Edaphochlamys debaryana TaxID=47281 RepID=A0A835YDY5_9CHLO|nr:hypothetical protein HYH03_006068 [Edaphochlamys debaryana]|eukprot:KAG2495829.1 hypothetical protein HYH03_006068 [Edaphochlamys debaryana]